MGAGGRRTKGGEGARPAPVRKSMEPIILILLSFSAFFLAIAIAPV